MLPLTDIVVDTNILMHANNPEALTQGFCIKLITHLLNSTEQICIDKEVNVNVSACLHEYNEKLKDAHGTIGKAFLEKMLQWQRFKPVKKEIEYRKKRLVTHTIDNEKPVDKTFVIITCNSVDKVFVSDDHEDFQTWKRDLFNKELEIDILTAEEVLA